MGLKSFNEVDIYFILFILFKMSFILSNAEFEGRYSRQISTKYHLTIPRKVSANGSLITFKLPHFYQHDFTKHRIHRKLDINGIYNKDEDPDTVHYQIPIAGDIHHIKLIPNHGFMSPNLVIERFAPSPESRKLKRIERSQCYYTGVINGEDTSSVALSLCDGLIGYISSEKGLYAIEPVREHVANKDGHYLHIVHERPKLQKHFFGEFENNFENFEENIYKREANSEYLNTTDSKHLNLKSYGKPKVYPNVYDFNLKKGLNKTKSHKCGTHKWGRGWARSFRRLLTEDKNINKRTYTSEHRYIESLVVVDKKFIEFHKNEDYETYLLTMMNMVSNFYHEASVGNMIDVVIVRIIYLDKEEEEIDLDINPNAEKSLESFCKWQKRINFHKDHPNHHDVAMLVTRHDICDYDDNEENCGLLGLAYVSGICDKKHCCSINQDTGLSLGIVLTHELGHLLGSSHDGQESNCSITTEDGFFHVMAPEVHVSTINWSKCSKAYITRLFEEHLGECLSDEPTAEKYKVLDMLPGAMYDADYQCKSMPMKTSACPFKNCKSLSCYVNKDKCGLYSDTPPFDGTKCGSNKWCYQKKCVEIGERPNAVNGGWGKWKSWSECSRTCGGGVAISIRECDNPKPENKGLYCLGERKRAKMCNTKSCGEKAMSYRNAQCAELNTETEKFKSYIPTGKIERCKLYCLQLEDGPLYTHDARDGTPCFPGTKNVCVSSVCSKVGCDWEFNSNAIEDRCGICKGNGLECKIITGVFKEEPKHKGQVLRVLTIPKGAARIRIEEEAPSPNIMLITNTGSNLTFLLNSPGAEENDTQLEIEGAEALYEHPEPKREVLRIPEHLQSDIMLMIWFGDVINPGFSYTYVMPGEPSGHKPRYQWEMLTFGPCSARCGGGTEVAEPQCVEDVAGKVDDKFCDQAMKPKPLNRGCNFAKCKTRWRVGHWSRCSGCFMRLGFEIRDSECVSESPMPGGGDVVMEFSMCSGRRPSSVRVCASARPCKGRKSRGFLRENVAEELWYQTDPDIENYLKRSFKSKDKTSNSDKTLKISVMKFSPKINEHTGQIENKTTKSITDKVSDKDETKRNILKENSTHITYKNKTQVKKKKEPKNKFINDSAASVKDFIPKRTFELKEVPVLKHKIVNMSDQAYEEIGDLVIDEQSHELYSNETTDFPQIEI